MNEKNINVAIDGNQYHTKIRRGKYKERQQRDIRYLSGVYVYKLIVATLREAFS